jgi:hypothetical protein
LLPIENSRSFFEEGFRFLFGSFESAHSWNDWSFVVNIIIILIQNFVEFFECGKQ